MGTYWFGPGLPFAFHLLTTGLPVLRRPYYILGPISIALEVMTLSLTLGERHDAVM